MRLRILLQVFKPITFVLAAICFVILCPLVILGQVFPGTPIVEMAVSYLPQVVLLSGLAALGLAAHRPRVAILGGAMTLVAALPFLTFAKYQAPGQSDCAPGACLTVITANVFERSESMSELGKIAQRENADLVAINEASHSFGLEDFQISFPGFERLSSAAEKTPTQHSSKALTLLSRKPVEHVVQLQPNQAAGRSLFFADLAGTWSGTRVVITHPLIPISQSWTEARNSLLEFAGNTAADADNFILMGDFNTTPWSATFRKLPGKRAGDPRFSATWPTFFPLMGIPIDHIMASEDLELVEFKILDSVGSDHYPLMARFRKK